MGYGRTSAKPAYTRRLATLERTVSGTMSVAVPVASIEITALVSLALVVVVFSANTSKVIPSVAFISSIVVATVVVVRTPCLCRRTQRGSCGKREHCAVVLHRRLNART